MPQNLNNLQTLNCSGTPITKLPPNLNNLQELDCSETQITELPPNLNNLQILGCSRTQITELPQNLNNLQKLVCSRTLKIPNYIRRNPDIQIYSFYFIKKQKYFNPCFYRYFIKMNQLQENQENQDQDQDQDQLIVQPYKNCLLVSGPTTTKYKDHLKECGLAYNGNLKGWICKVADKKQMIAKMSKVVKIVEVHEAKPTEVEILKAELISKDQEIYHLNKIIEDLEKKLGKSR